MEMEVPGRHSAHTTKISWLLFIHMGGAGKPLVAGPHFEVVSGYTQALHSPVHILRLAFHRLSKGSSTRRLYVAT